MEANRHISKGAAGGVIVATVVVVLTASAFALNDEPGSFAAAVLSPAPTGVVPGADSTLSDTTESSVALVESAPMSSAEAALPKSRESARAAGENPKFEGRASFYGFRFEGRPTANGEPFEPMALTAAHRTLPFGSQVRVTNTSNGRSVVVRINDRGPFVHGRVLDLSRGAAEKIDMIGSGVAHVRLEVLP